MSRCRRYPELWRSPEAHATMNLALTKGHRGHAPCVKDEAIAGTQCQDLHEGRAQAGFIVRNECEKIDIACEVPGGRGPERDQ